jgi:D-alanyl-D-alanine carboxypeptidase
MPGFPFGAVAAAIVALGTACAISASPAGADPLPPPDHDGVRVAMQQAVAGGSPAYLFGAIDATGSWSAAAGVADVSTQTPASPDAAFRIGSISKMFVAVAVLRLVADGKIGLDTPIDNYLPGLLKLGNVITIRELLQHRSGLGPGKFEGWGPFDSVCRIDYDPFEVVKRADVQLFAPGTAWSYSNAGYTALELVLEKVTGESYEQVLTAQIVSPLHLSSTSFQDGVPSWPTSYLHGYWVKPGTGHEVRLQDESACKTSIFGAAGSGISTTHDLTTFMQALMQGRLLPDALFRQMISTEPTDGPGYNYGFDGYGLGISRIAAPCGVVLFGHTGHVAGYRATLYSTLDGSRIYADASTADPIPDAVSAAAQRARRAEICGTS